MSFRKGSKRQRERVAGGEDSKRLTGLFVGGFGHGRRFVSTEAHTNGMEREKRESKKGKVKEMKEKRKRKTERETCE